MVDITNIGIGFDLHAMVDILRMINGIRGTRKVPDVRLASVGMEAHACALVDLVVVTARVFNAERLLPMVLDQRHRLHCIELRCGEPKRQCLCARDDLA